MVPKKNQLIIFLNIMTLFYPMYRYYIKISINCYIKTFLRGKYK